MLGKLTRNKTHTGGHLTINKNVGHRSLPRAVLEIIFLYSEDIIMSFQIFLLVGHLTNWTGHNLLTDNTLKKRTQDVVVTCSVIVSDHNVKLAGHFQNLVGQCLMTDCYFQHCRESFSLEFPSLQLHVSQVCRVRHLATCITSHRASDF